MRRALPLLLLLGCDEPARRRDEAAAYGAAYPDGTRGVGLLVDMLDDDDPSVREAAEQSLVALGRKGLADLSRYMKDPKEPSRKAFAEIGGVFARLGPALTTSDLADVMAGSYGPLGRRAAVASAGLAACWDGSGRDPMIDILTVVRRDAEVSGMASASLAILGWSAAADKHAASAADVKDLAAMVVAPPDAPWSSCVAAATIALLRPRSEWPRHVADYPYASQHKDPAPDPGGLHDLRATLRSFEASAGRRNLDMKRSPALRDALGSVRALGVAAEPAKPELLRLLATERGLDRVEVARTLLAVDPSAADAVARALGEELRGVSPAADEALSLLSRMGLGARSAAPALIEVLGVPSWNEEDVPNPAEACAQLGSAFQRELRAKRAAASILGRLGAKEAGSALKALTSHKDVRLRYRAAVALRRIGAG